MFEQFVDAYVTAALWSSNDDNDSPLDKNYDSSDIAPEAMEQIRKDCKQFYKENYEMISDDVEQAGHDFWLTRCGHGAGFWDGDWPENGDKLTEASKKFGECWLYVGDDNKVYIM